MPSQLHEGLLLLFRSRPTLAPELMRDALHVSLPAFTEARIDSADLTAQLARDPRKKFVWPVYAASLRARLEIPVSLFVISTPSVGGCLVTARLSAATIDELDAIGERLLSAQSLEEALGPK